ncbi:TetR/AcrR family transcriptional regulator [Bizionia gelidisalsuginis]|uniref:TetR/AcrR family transcriptional regulator n=2 Tax=Bizionia TaxID=283785 RepID=A0A8H2LDC6_9FLAO|nr:MULTISPECIES: TetR/AcrR family transcriptional regulator [Bizionia]TYB76085.1 TetR/AcrR family transcriptional regulator [Bizionia saleffrena]TYC11377.1 TetR/AcrR family transcriptional regulator [Bizionia gelidisalsuginis]
MRTNIIIKSTELFLSLGFKSVTMDKIANELGISKKTIYQHFDNKTKLVEAVTWSIFENITIGIEAIIKEEKNPIEEIYQIKCFVLEHLKDEKSSPQYQLQKYYPKIFKAIKTEQSCVMGDCVKSNLKRGMALNLYRETIDIDFISKIYFNTIFAIKDKDIFPLKKFSMNMLMEHFIEYHLRGICTPLGVETLEKQTKITKNPILN